MDSVQKNREKPAIENYVQHAELNMPEYVRSIVSAKYIRDSVGFKDRHGKWYPGDGA